MRPCFGWRSVTKSFHSDDGNAQQAPSCADGQRPDVKTIRSPGLLIVSEGYRTTKLVARSGSLHWFFFSELDSATQNFSSENLLGGGGFGGVFKGYIDEHSFMPSRAGQGMPIAVKRLNPGLPHGQEEWLAEVRFLRALDHPNVIKLIGACTEGNHRLLVYEFMAEGSLATHLHPKDDHHQTLPWATRLKIALDLARAVTFLHSAPKPIIHRDIKPGNILLDSEYNAKLSDFGSAKEGPQGDQIDVTAQPSGTVGYIDPEHVLTGSLSAKSDVYSFGVVLLEMLTGRTVLDKKSGVMTNIVPSAMPYLTDPQKTSFIMDERLNGQYSETGAQGIALLAYHCLSHQVFARPTMHEVLKAIELVLENDYPSQ